jgi:hypothetical protein
MFCESAALSAGPDLNALAGELNARLALHDHEYKHACGCAEQALAALGAFDIPMIAWRIEATASDCYRLAGDAVRAEQHGGRANAIVGKLIDSFDAGEPLRQSFAACAAVRRVAGLG